jgi:hypothetical protein
MEGLRASVQFAAATDPAQTVVTYTDRTTRPLHPSRLDGEEVPDSGYALELVFAA